MDELVAALRRQRAVTALVPLFFVSGATGLIYQTIWGRELHLVFGTSTFAIATVLTAFMAGLALGGAWMGRRADTVARPLAIYGALEVGIGVFAVVFPSLLHAVEPIYLAAWRTWAPTPVAFGVVQLLLVGSLLVLPTAAMGATLPLLARFATDRMGAAGDRVGLLYAVNTAGAVVGTWAAGFLLLPALGLSRTTWLAAVANVVLGLLALGLSRWTSGVQVALDAVAEPEPAVAPPSPRASRAVAWSAACAGFASLVYEVAWFRVLGLMLGASVYAFSVMLLAFLVGIAIGGRVGGWWADRLFARGGAPRVLAALAVVQVGVATLSITMMHVYQELPFWYVWLFDAFSAEAHPSLTWTVSLLLAGLVMTPPALLMGAAFPLAVRAAVGDARAVGAAVGRIYGANTAGGVLGAALAGFVLLPMLAVRGTVALAAAVNVVAALVAWAGQDAPGPALRTAWGRGLGAALATLAVVGLVVPPGWDPLLMTAGMYKYVTSFSDHSRAGILDYAVDQYDLLYYREGLSSVVTVARNKDSGNIWLANNGKVDASTTIDMPTQVMVSLLPMQFVAAPTDVLVIGLASGITAGGVTLVDDVQRLDVVELEPAIRPAAELFADFNHGVLDDPRTHLVLNDGRNHVLLTPPGTYDVIVSEPSNPWLTGVSNLFTEQFFTLGKARLKPGGIWSQWVQLYGMDDDDLRSLLATFAAVYPYMQVYAAAEDADLVLLGAEHPFGPDAAAAAHLLGWPAVADELDVVQLATVPALIGAWLMDRDEVLRMVGDTPRNTDDNMRIEYNAPLNLHRDTQALNVPMLMRHAQVPWRYVDDPALLAEVALRYDTDDDLDRAIDAMLRAGLALPVDDPLREERIEQAFTWYREGRGSTHDVGGTARELLWQAFLEQRVQPLFAPETR
ncbi:MAG: fused MFS/spermidine synthase [Alphaproteobacteria bacterium]|nr:fused MFS/spermidine synthase [Alphaproteobacteria bacterium]